MSEPCKNCPIAEHCLRRKQFCDWMAAENPDPRRVRHIIGRSKLAAGIELEYPSTLAQAGNALAAAGRVVSAWFHGEKVAVGAEEAARRLEICVGCPKFDHGQHRCTICGCFSKFKNFLATEHCPLPPEEGGPKW
jgi:hypothetical protein